ncbi:MAG: hypothetical protein HFH94_05750 [Lachnospiraceae bacterium]|nr:hypothetical protein [uncultured Acetatifactor sp.]MCI9219225.1 hypothetical protein [Lachnospiraceae bacterium]
MEYITFPWEQMGLGLRRLSLSGSAGNIAAWILFLAAGALPLFTMAFLRYRRKSCRADYLLPLLSVSLFAGLWFFINPSYMDRYLSPMPTGGIAKYSLAAVIYSLFLTWILLRLVFLYEKAGQGRLLAGLRILLGLYGLVLGIGLFVQSSVEFREALRALQESNTGSDSHLVRISTLFLAIQVVIGILPTASQIALLFMMVLFLRRYEKEPFGPEASLAMKRLKAASGRLLTVVLLANAGFNVLQLLCSRFLLTSFHRIPFPLSEILVMLGIRTLSFLYLESRRLKEDNDMFI